MSLTQSLLERRSALMLGLLLLEAAGIYALTTLPAGAYPEAVFPRIAIVATGGTFESGEMVVAVTRPLEEALSGVIDLRQIRSRTVRGGAELSLYFRPGADMPFALQQVQGRIAALQRSLPGDVEIRAERLTPSVFPMMQYQLTGGDLVLLRDLAQYVIRPRLTRLPDVGVVEVQGGQVREIAVVLDPPRLIANLISVTDVADAIRRSNLIEAAGRIDRESRQNTLVVSGLAAGPEDVGRIVVKQTGDRLVHVADLGSVGYGIEDVFQLTAGNGRPAALINVSRQPAGNTLKVENAVQAAVAEIRTILPAGVHFDLVYDQGRVVRESLASVRDAMLVGGALAILVLLGFLGRLDLALIAGTAIPLTLVATFAGIALAGDSLNLMSLGGLAVAIGLIIDDAVVVVDNIERHLGLEPAGPVPIVIRRAVGEILAPVAGSTLTTVVVFAPLALLEGVVGQFFRSFSLALSIAVLLSLVVAVTVIPLVVEWQWERRQGRIANPRRRFQLARLSKVHSQALAVIQRQPRLAAGLVIGTVVVLGALARVVETGFMPDMDEGAFILDYATPTGTSLAESDRLLHQIETILAADDAVASFTRRTGAELGLFATEPNKGDMTILLKPRRERDATVYEVIDRVRAAIETNVPAVRVEFVQILQDLIGDLAGNPDPIELKLFAANLEAAERAAAVVAATIDTIPGLVDVFNGNEGRAPAIAVELDPDRVARAGLGVADVTAQARASLFGEPAGVVRETDRLIPIRARLPDSVRFQREIAGILPIIQAGRWLPLGGLGEIRDRESPSALTREDLRLVVRVTGRIDPARSSLGTVMARIRALVGQVVLPPGVSLELGGQYVTQRAAFRQLLLVFGLAAGAVLLVLVIQFGSMRGPLMIVAAACLGVAGALAALVGAGTPLNISSFMGLILLVGLVVKNGIILLDAARAFYRSGLDSQEALARAAEVRLRPILMTTLCTLAGLIPLAFGIGSGAELQQPLAIAVTGGLAFSTAVTLLLLPAGLAAVGAVEAGNRRGESYHEDASF